MRAELRLNSFSSKIIKLKTQEAVKRLMDNRSSMHVSENGVMGNRGVYREAV